MVAVILRSPVKRPTFRWATTRRQSWLRTIPMTEDIDGRPQVKYILKSARTGHAAWLRT